MMDGTETTAAADTVRKHRPVFEPAQVARYHEAGYLVVRDGFDRGLLDWMIAATEGLAAKSAAMTESDATYDLAPDHQPDAPRLRRISSPTQLDPVFFEAAFESRVGDMVADLIGGPAKFYHAKINFKQPGTHSAVVQWHQDWTHFPHTNANLLAISLPYFPRTQENGCIRFVAGSHRRGPLSIWRDGVYVFTCAHAMVPGDIENAEVVECEPGDIILHHGLIVHGSAPNASDRPAITFTAQYAAADSFAYTAPVIDSRHRNWMVRGAPARRARVEAMDVELPPDFSAGYTSLFTNQDKAASAGPGSAG